MRKVDRHPSRQSRTERIFSAAFPYTERRSAGARPCKEIRFQYMSCLHRLSCGWQQCKQTACKQKIKPAIGIGNGIARTGSRRSKGHTPLPHSTVPQCGNTASYTLFPSVSAHKQDPGWNDKKQQSSCHTRADWREHPQKYSKIHKAERRSEELSEISVSKSLFPLQRKGCIAEDKGKSR